MTYIDPEDMFNLNLIDTYKIKIRMATNHRRQTLSKLQEVARNVKERIHKDGRIEYQLERANKTFNTNFTIDQIKNQWANEKDSIIQMTKYEKKIHSLSQENKLLKDSIVNQEEMVSSLEEVITGFPNVGQIYKPVFIEGEDVEKAVLCFADPHIGEIVKPENIVPPLYKEGIEQEKSIHRPWFYGYNTDIALRRCEATIDKTIALIDLERKQRIINECYFLGLGDYVSGIIHAELERNSTDHIMRQVGIAGWVMARMIYELSQNFEKVYVLSVSGNHGRVEKKPYFKDQNTLSFDFMATQIASLFLKNVPNVKINIPHSPVAIVQIENWNYLICHGNNIPSHYGIPWYGIDKFSRDWSVLANSANINIDKVLMGHFHTSTNMPFVRTVGSIKGADEYSIMGLRKPANPSQTIFGVHRSRPETWTREIDYVDIESPTKPLRYILPSGDVWNTWAID